jgi:predicted DNA binding CopG/RHH family protein
MKYFELTKNEEKILKDFESDKLKKVRDFKKENSRYKQYARGTLSKAKNINIRIASRDLQKIKAKAVEKGIPYQTLVSSVLHQYSTGKAK